jgi:PKD repeat protein
VFLAACNLTSSPEEPIVNTPVATNTATLALTPGSTGFPTAITVTSLPGFTQQAPPTSIGFVPTAQILPTAQGTISIFIVSPIPGNILAGNVNVLGSALHPNFLQYYLEYGPDPNPNNLWYTIGGARLTPVSNSLLGIWSTNTIPDGPYQLRLRVFLRDGTITQTVVNNLRVQNTAPTLAPTPTQANLIPRPNAAFSASQYQGKAQFTVSFTNFSSGNITGYSWDFGDGTTSNERNPVHTFRNPGEYLVTLVAFGPGGRSNAAQATINVLSADPPIADFTANPTTGTAPLRVQFTNRSSGQITRFVWDFGDGVSSNERDPVHTFEYRPENQGQYNVILTARGPGGVSRKRLTITVQNPRQPAPVANFEPRTATGNAPFTVQFTDRSTGAITGYTWDFGDNTGSTSQNPSHTYVSEGTYTVTLTVSGEGGSTSITGTITVTRPPQAPDAQFTMSPLEGPAPLTVQFTDTSVGTVNSRLWEFGNGETSTVPNPRITFTNPGSYTIRLTVTGANNLSDFTTQTLSVFEPIRPPNADFTANPPEGPAPLDVTFNNLSSGTNITYLWNFGDGNTSTESGATLIHRYQNAGDYSVTLTVTNAQGQSDTHQLTVRVLAVAPPTSTPAPATSTAEIPTATFTVEAPTATFTVEAPTATFTPEPPTATATAAPVAPIADFSFGNPPGDPLVFQFTDLSQGTVTSRVWTFGDPNGSTSTDQNPSFAYPGPGTYTVTLTVANDGGSNSISKDVVIIAPTATTAPPPTADFTFDNSTDLTVQFTDASTGASPIVAWSWDFGDGSALNTEQNPLYTFSAGGIYSVILTITDQNGQTASITQEVEVTEPQDDSIADTTPVLPELDLGTLAGIASANPGLNPNAFTFAGDATVADPDFLRPFADGGTVDDPRSYLDPTIQAFIDSGSFAQTSVASGFLVRQLVQDTADGCNGETLFQCELTRSNAAVVVISVGYQDARQGTTPEDFRANLEILVDQATARGVIPVLLTVQNRPGNEDLIRPINEQIIEVAESRDLPVVNIWRMVNDINGLDGNALSVFGGGADVLTAETIDIYGQNSRNFYVLDVLHAIRQQVLGQ